MRTRTLFPFALTTVLAGALLTAPAAAADTVEVEHSFELRQLLTDCTADDAPFTAVLATAVILTDTVATCDGTIDLAGRSLTINTLKVAAGSTLAVTGSGVVDAVHHTVAGASVTVEEGAEFVVDGPTASLAGSFPGGPGITGAGILRVVSGQVIATGAEGGPFSTANGGAGISSALVVEGGSVAAQGGPGFSVQRSPSVMTSGGGGAGIAARDVTVTGGEVTATGGDGATGTGGGAGIGGSGGKIADEVGGVEVSADAGGAGGSVVISGGIVTAIGTDGGSAIGAGAGGTGFGTLELGGTLRIPEGVMIVHDSSDGPELTISETGLVTGNPATPTDGATISGDGQIANGGVIALDDEVAVTVTGNTHLVSFDTQGEGTDAQLRVFAPDIATGFRALPTPPAPYDWNTQPDGSGDWFDAATALVGDPTVYAAIDPTTRFDHLQAYLAVLCESPTTLTLGADFEPAGSLFETSLSIACDTTLDLNGHLLDVGSVRLSDVDLTIDDTSAHADGVLTATAPNGNHSGIDVPEGSSLTIDGGIVTATGSGTGPGIGARQFTGAPGPVTITGGTVTATGGSVAAGIGGGSGTPGLDLTISGGTVTAQGYSAVGAGSPCGAAAGFGQLTLGGTLHVPSGRLIVPDSSSSPEITITETGLLLGVDGDETSGAAIVGATPADTGQIDNHGVIALDDEVGIPVLDRNHLVTFDFQNEEADESVRLFAEIFDSGYRTIPTRDTLVGWNTLPDATGTAFTSTTPVTADLTVYAIFDADGDGVPNALDVCDGTVLPDPPSRALKPNHYAATADGFVDADGTVVFSMLDVGGCSGSQIVAAADLGKGHLKHGLSNGELQAWIGSVDG